MRLVLQIADLGAKSIRFHAEIGLGDSLAVVDFDEDKTVALSLLWPARLRLAPQLVLGIPGYARFFPRWRGASSSLPASLYTRNLFGVICRTRMIA